MILVTGGCGFIGSNFIGQWLDHTDEDVLNLDALTYAGNPENTARFECDPRYHFFPGNVADRALVRELLGSFAPRAVIHFAAESHVDRSIAGPEVFFETNVMGTLALIEEVRSYYERLTGNDKAAFRFIQAGTDEVYGSLPLKSDGVFTEASPYAPNSPYAASKAAADHIAHAWFHTYGFPAIITNCSNNYGPCQYPEKLIPLSVVRALAGEKIPVYGTGCNVRDWIHVSDHCRAILAVLEKGVPGQRYNIGAGVRKSVLEIVTALCRLLDELAPKAAGSYAEQIAFVADRAGNDLRYALDPSHITRDLGWKPQVSFDGGLRETVRWYLENPAWIKAAAG